MNIVFYKYQGTGNDFILVDNRDMKLSRQNKAVYRKWCDRRFGIGADGLILLQKHEGSDFEMVYFNSDGGPSSMCGNGGRCIVRFAADLGLVRNTATFLAVDGMHEATIEGERISLKMSDVKGVEDLENTLILNTGSPHYVKFCNKDIHDTDIVTEAREIRNSERFKKGGINVNFVNRHPDHLFVRTYERGVEDETYSCGTGVTAVALASGAGKIAGQYEEKVWTPGGKLSVSFQKISEQEYRDIWLRGPAEFVFKGEINYEGAP